MTSHYDVMFTFPSNVLAKFVDLICILYYTHSPYSFMCNFMRHCIDFKLSALQVRIPEHNLLIATTEQSKLQNIQVAR